MRHPPLLLKSDVVVVCVGSTPSAAAAPLSLFRAPSIQRGGLLNGRTTGVCHIEGVRAITNISVKTTKCNSHRLSCLSSMG